MFKIYDSRSLRRFGDTAGLAVLLGSASVLAACLPASAQSVTLPGVTTPITGTLTPSVTTGTVLGSTPAELQSDVAQVANLANLPDTATVNVGELRGLTTELGGSTAAALGGGAVYNPILGTVSLPTFQIRGTGYTNVGAALNALDLALGGNTGTGPTTNLNFATTDQLNALAHGAVQYDRATDGSTLASVSLNSDAGGPVVIHNLAPGVATNDAATVGQVQAATNNAVQYTTVNGVKSNTVLLSGGSPGGVVMSNLAPGQQGTDAVNLNQLQSYSGNMLGQSQAYTDAQIGNLRAFTDKAIASARRDAAGGTAVALAATGIRFDDLPGKISVGGATSYYNGQAGLAFGVGATSETGRVRVNAAVAASPTIDHPEVGGVVGASFAIN